MMIGDGKTDLETQPFVHTFIGYGGNVERNTIKEKVNFYPSVGKSKG